MLTRIFPIDIGDLGRLAIMPRPRGGDWLHEEVAAWQGNGIDVVVSLLEADETAELELRQEGELCCAAGIEFLSLPIEDRCVPSDADAVASLSATLLGHLRHGKSVAIHCRAGIGRSSLIAACVMVQAGYDVAHALSLIVTARGIACPDTDEQREWIRTFGKSAAQTRQPDPGFPSNS